MEFCSEYGYNYGFEGSDSEEYLDQDETTGEKIKKKIRKADTNIIAVNFDRFVEANEMFAGEPKGCKKCGAIMSFLSEKNIVKKNDKLIWSCEFCMKENDMTNIIDDLNEIPKTEDVTFMLEIKPKETVSSAKQVSNDDGYLGFCIDISGSMGTSIPVGRNNERQTSLSRLNGVKIACLKTLKKLKDDEPSKRVALITFSDTVKYYGDCSTIQNHKPILDIGGNVVSFENANEQNGQNNSRMRNIFKKFSISKLIKLKSFSKTSDPDDENVVTTSGAAATTSAAAAVTNIETQSPPKDLDNKQRILALADHSNGDLKAIKESHSFIEDRMRYLRTEGSTALGPALLFAVGYAAKKPGSSIILCTDGCANIGLGSVEQCDKDSSEQKFYDEVADYAKEKGVVVNVLSMKGTDCKLALLGRVADRSNGTLNIVDPLNLSNEFVSIIENRIVGTNVVAKLIVNHKYLYIRDEKLEAQEGKAIDTGDDKAKEALDTKKKSVVVKNIGNANINTEITFEYGIRKLSGKDEKKEDLKKMPFQLQIIYTAPDGSKAVRVYTKILKFTTDRKIAERNIQSENIIFSHNSQTMANHFLTSNTISSKYRSEAVGSLLTRNELNVPKIYSEFSTKIKSISKSMQSQDMDDTEANQMFYQAKMSKSRIRKT